MRAGLLDVVALLDDEPSAGLRAGAVGTVVDLLSDFVVLVEFCDDSGETYALAPLALNRLLVLRYQPEAA